MISALIPCSCCSRSTTIWSLWYHRLLLCAGPDSNSTPTEESPVRWSDLPPELWELIGNGLETEIDVLRFRSVCSLWRQAYLLPDNSLSPLPGLRRKKIFHIIPLRHRPQFFGNKNQSKLQFMKLYSSRLMYDNETRGNESTLNLLDFRINQVAESYTYKFIREICKKIIISPNSATTIVAVYGGGKLGFTKEGYRNVWTLIDECNKNYEDIIVYKKKIYAINRNGEIFKIMDEDSMKLVKLPVPAGCGYGKRKHLVECGGEIYVVNRLVDGRRLQVRDFEVYRLDEEQGRWIYVENLGNYSFVLRKDCSFSVGEGLKKNCIYFNNVQHWQGTYSICALFDLKRRRFMNLL